MQPAQELSQKPLQQIAVSGLSRRELAMYRIRKAPLDVPAKHRNAIRRSLEWLTPRRAMGYRDSVSLILGVPFGTIKHWLAGRRKLPGWARDRLLEQVRARLEQGRLIEAELAAYKPPVRSRHLPVKKKPPNEGGSSDSRDSPR